MQSITKTGHMGRRIARALMAVWLLVICCAVLQAQSDLGSIRGTIQDQTGAVIPAAGVQLLNVDTGTAQTAVSDASGSFHFEAVSRGNYKVTVTAPNFETAVQPFTLNVSQVQALAFHLKPGSTTTTVNVTGAAPIVDTTTSSVGAVIDVKQVSNLPLNGLNFTQLALLAPGVTRPGQRTLWTDRRHSPGFRASNAAFDAPDFLTHRKNRRRCGSPHNGAATSLSLPLSRAGRALVSPAS